MLTNPSIHAALVLGSDSFRLLVASIQDGQARVLDSVHAPLRLAAALDARDCLDPEAIGAARDCLRGMAERLAARRPASVRVVATSTLRMARNSDVFLPQAREVLGHPIEILSGEDEAMLTWLGAAGGAGVDGARLLVLGIGGGSTQLALGGGGEAPRAASIALGTARLGLSFFSGGRIDAVSFAAAMASSRVRLASQAAAWNQARHDRACGASGTVHTLARLAAAGGLHRAGESLSRSGLETLRERVLVHGTGGAPLAGLGTLRLRDVAAALAILLGAMEELGIGDLALPEGGLRAGLLAEAARRAALQAATA